MEHEKLIIDAEALRDDIIGVVDRSTDLREVHPAQFKQRVRCLVSNWNASTEDLSPPAAGPSAPFYCAIAKISTFIDAIERFLDLVKDMEACLQEIERDSAWAAQLLARLAWPDGLPKPDLVSRLENLRGSVQHSHVHDRDPPLPDR